MSSSLEEIFQKLYRKKSVWQSIIRAIETAISKIRSHAANKGDELILSSIESQINYAKKQFNAFDSRLNDIKPRIHNKSEYQNIKKDLTYLNTEAQLAIEQLREIAKDIVDIKTDTNSSIMKKTMKPISKITVSRKQSKQRRETKPPQAPHRRTPQSLIIDHVHISPDDADKFYSSSSSPSSTMIKQKNEIADIRERIKHLRDTLPRDDVQKTESKQQQQRKRNYFDKSAERKKSKYSDLERFVDGQNKDSDSFHTVDSVKDEEQKQYLIKLDKFGNEMKNGLNASWTKLGVELNKNAESSASISEEVTKLKDKLKRYQNIINSAAELCSNSAQVINDKNQDFKVIMSEKEKVEERLNKTMKELERMKQTNEEMKSKWRQRCVELEADNEKLKSTLTTMQGDFQYQIDGLKKDLSHQINQRKESERVSSDEKANFRESLDHLLRKLEFEDESVKDEVDRIMKKYRQRRSNIFERANRC